MKFEETHAFRARTAHCSHQAGLIEDSILKKFWDDLADDWIALESAMLAVKNATTIQLYAHQRGD